MNISSNETVTTIGSLSDAEIGRCQQQKQHQQECVMLQPRQSQSLQVGGTTTGSYQDELYRVQRRLSQRRSAKQQSESEGTLPSSSPSVIGISNQQMPFSSSRSGTLPPRSLVRSSSLRSLPPRSACRSNSLAVGSSSLTTASPSSITDMASTPQRSSSCRSPPQGDMQSSVGQPSDLFSTTKSTITGRRHYQPSVTNPQPEPSLQRLDSSFRYRATNHPSQQHPNSSKSFRRQQIAKTEKIFTDHVDPTAKALHRFGHDDPPTPTKKLSAIQRLILGKEYVPKESKSMRKAYRKELAENLNHETWIQKMILYTDDESKERKEPPIVFWQSIESGRCCKEPPSGSYRCVYLDDVVIRRKKPKPPAAPAEAKKKRKFFTRKRSKVSAAKKKESKSAATSVNKTPEENPTTTTIDNKRAQLKPRKSKFKSSRSLKSTGEDIVVEV